MPSKIKLNHNGNEIEISPDDLQLPEGYQLVGPNAAPDGYVEQGQVDNIVSQRVKSAKQNAIEDFKGNQDNIKGLVKDYLSQYDAGLDENGKPKGYKTTEDVQELRKTWEQSNLKPVREKLEQRNQRLQSLESSMKYEKIRSDAAGLVDKKFLSGPVDIAKQLADNFKYDPEMGRVVQVDETGSPVLHPNGTKANNHGYVEPKDFFELKRNDEDWKHIYADNSQGGSGYNGTNPDDANKTISRDQFEKLDPGKRNELMQKGYKLT